VLAEQNTDLARAQSGLEELVAKRTRELEDANRALQEANERLQKMAMMDGLLGIANRRFAEEKLEEEWRRGARERKPLAVLMIDVDEFKRYNDHYGHQAGDRCLQAVARAAASALRRPGDLLGRYGGDELLIVLPDTESEGAHAVAHSVCAKIRELNIPHATSTVARCVTASIGVASTVPRKSTAAHHVVAAADRALYAAKEGGRDRVCVE
jgi:diguanylate cyclase (GGDEF)-like protein